MNAPHDRMRFFLIRRVRHHGVNFAERWENFEAVTEVQSTRSDLFDSHRPIHLIHNATPTVAAMMARPNTSSAVFGSNSISMHRVAGLRRGNAGNLRGTGEQNLRGYDLDVFASGLEPRHFMDHLFCV